MSISNTNLSTTSPYSTSTTTHTTTSPPPPPTTTSPPPPPTTTSPPPPPTTISLPLPPPTTTSPSNQCYVFGSYYPRNSTIAEDYNADSNICAYVGVDENCNVIQRYQQNCRPPDCVFNGLELRVGDSIYNSCNGAFCAESGLIEWDHCGCFRADPYNYYPLGTSITTDSRGCAGIICEKGSIWKPWNDCPPNTTTTTRSVTTTPDITPSTTTPLSTTTPSSLCQYNGHALDIGETIPTDDRWCSGVTCTENGIVQWDYFNCTGTTTPGDLSTTQTTTDRTTTPAMTTNNPNNIKKMQLKEKMKENVKTKLESWVKMKANKEISRKQFLKIKQKMKNRMKKKLTRKIQKMKKKQKMKSKKKN